VRFWVAGTEVWGRIPGWLGFEKRGGEGPGGICVCLLACLPEIQWLRRRARRDSAMVERILTLINIYIFICAPFFAYFAAKFGPFRSLLIKSPLQCNTSIYMYVCMAFVRLSKTLIAPFLIVKQFESVFLLSIRTQKWFLCPALPAI